MPAIHTIELRAVEPTHKRALQNGKDALHALLGVTIPTGWPQFPQAFTPPASAAVDADPPPDPWSGYFFIHAPERALVGNGGFKGPPDDAGRVEIGYEIASEYWNRGFATAAARALLDLAFADDRVQAVEACTLAEPNASNRVLQKLGMTFVDEQPNASVGAVWRWRVSAAEYRGG